MNRHFFPWQASAGLRKWEGWSQRKTENIPYDTNPVKCRHKARYRWRWGHGHVYELLLCKQIGTESWGKNFLCLLRGQHLSTCTENSEHLKQQHERFVKTSHRMALEGSEVRRKSQKPFSQHEVGPVRPHNMDRPTTSWDEMDIQALSSRSRVLESMLGSNLAPACFLELLLVIKELHAQMREGAWEPQESKWLPWR